ncbi:MAG: uracil-DNA glycosylase [Pyrinomonadaceae bacterium]|nr:uracil-DNA glycosylase [Pyrinomonadaceae bacterium]MDW8304687.1 uracil-DNA glycosylase [Acidobacteriota bacterium]
MKEELKELISGLRANLSYLRDLGVRDLWIEKQEQTVPEIKSSEEAKVFKPSISLSSQEKQAERNERLANIIEKLRPSKLNIGNLDSFEKKPALLFDTITPAENQDNLEKIRADIGDCHRCPLYKHRTQIVHSKGNPNAKLMFIGEAPGADEDIRGEPFVGRAGQLLTKIIEAIELKREEVFIGNINRCRPPGNRQPTPEEAKVCREFIIREIFVIRPVCIVTLGSTACQYLLNTKVSITKIRGQFQDFQGIKVMPTFHPAYLLRDPSKKRDVWEDMKKVRDYLKSFQ